MNRRATRVAAGRLAHRLAVIVDPLEARRLMAIPEPLVDRVDEHLWNAVEAHERGATGAELPANVDRRVQFDSQGNVQAYVRVDGHASEMAEQLRTLGVQVEAANDEMSVVQGWIDPDNLARVAQANHVLRVDVPDYAQHNAVTSAGDAALNADKVRARFLADGVNGSGIKIGVISDGVNHKADVGAELPAVTVNPSIPGNGDEGTAMLEIVHDLAPGAQLYFSGPSTSVQMVNSINWLVGQGCNVIVDDLGFFAESYFADTAVAQAAQNAVNSGVVYVTSAGNFGNAAHYQANYVQGQSAFNGGVLHRFGGPGQETNQVVIPKGASFRAFLQWSDQPGASANNYDLYLYQNDATDFAELDHSTTIQNGNDNPFEYVTWTNNTSKSVTAELWINRKSGAAARELELFTLGNTSLKFTTQSDMLFGQEAVADVMSVAAASAGSPSSVEAFSSRGGSSIYNNFATQTKAQRQTLDGTAIDGVQTAVGQAGFFYNPFYGTSAAAPHAAAIAALVRQVNPSLTPAQVVQIMAETAVDLGAAGYDVNSGAGRYDALAAVYDAYTPNAPDLSAASDTGVSSSDDLTKDATPTFTGVVPLGSSVRLLIDGVSVATQTVGSNSDNFAITVPASLADGTHVATIRIAPPGSLGTAAESSTSASLTFKIDTVAPIVTVPLAFNIDAPVQSLTMTFNEPMSSSFDTNALLLTSPSIGGVPFAAKAVAWNGNVMTMTFPGYANGVLPDGTYLSSFAFGPPTDPAGNAGAASPDLSFFVLAGDATRDGKVAFDDLLLLAKHYNTAGQNFTGGNFDYDAAGTVGFADLLMLAKNYNKNIGVAQAQAVPVNTSSTPPARRRTFSESVLT